MLTFADSIRPSGQSRFLIGVVALGIAQTTLTDASKSTDKAESCRLTRVGADHIAMARAGLGAGDESFVEAAKQAMGFLDQLDPFAQQQLKLCGGDPGTAGATPHPRR